VCDLLEVILVVLTWIVGYLSALKINEIKTTNERNALIGTLKSELNSFNTVDVSNVKEKIKENSSVFGVDLFVTPFREDYIDWILSRGILTPQKDHDLVKALVNVKATLTNFNMAVLMWNMGSMRDLGIIEDYGRLVEDHIDELRKVLS